MRTRPKSACDAAQIRKSTRLRRMRSAFHLEVTCPYPSFDLGHLRTYMLGAIIRKPCLLPDHPGGGNNGHVHASPIDLLWCDIVTAIAPAIVVTHCTLYQIPIPGLHKGSIGTRVSTDNIAVQVGLSCNACAVAGHGGRNMCRETSQT